MDNKEQPGVGLRFPVDWVSVARLLVRHSDGAAFSGGVPGETGDTNKRKNKKGVSGRPVKLPEDKPAAPVDGIFDLLCGTGLLLRHILGADKAARIDKGLRGGYVPGVSLCVQSDACSLRCAADTTRVASNTVNQVCIPTDPTCASYHLFLFRKKRHHSNCSC